ncbi:hypothetical protein FisN_4Lh539 [Fistulifera solaris]|uniref:Uncharacterized protein n=1 Tax=Fistulifera solaris TaxID=1519565 RepID=A0A1Z5KDN4_FISSO|nr:hypothetical protein FisN_4Lh539 [Fistulifera solaris]|eukprot:GAX24404.1 hypothetical protein FisN_4Lh539 [Fistulifera solaris]
MTLLVRRALDQVRFILLALPLLPLLFEADYSQYYGNRKLQVALETFHQLPITYNDQFPLDSTVHCIGGTFGTFQQNDWLYRSCEFRNICFDLEAQEFVLFPSKEEQQLADLLKRNPLVSLSTVSSPSLHVALGAVDPPDPSQLNDREKMQVHKKNLAWFPLVRNTKVTKGYYELPESHILVPFQENHPMSPDSLVNKDFLSLFTLLYEFGLELKKPIYIRHGKNLPLCDKECETLLKTHLRIDASKPVLSGIDHRSSDLVCAKYGVAGLGMRMTGKGPVREKDGSWLYTHTVGRHATKRVFQKYMEATETTAQI